MGDPAAGAGRGPHHLTGGVVEPVEAHQQQVGEVDRQPRAALVAVALGAADELLGEERVAPGPLDDRPHLRSVSALR